jgi:hypothetical protein
MNSEQFYASLKLEIEDRIEELKERLAQHSEEQSKDPKNWNYGGDLANINNVLKQLTEGW